MRIVEVEVLVRIILAGGSKGEVIHGLVAQRFVLETQEEIGGRGHVNSPKHHFIGIIVDERPRPTDGIVDLREVSHLLLRRQFIMCNRHHPQ